ncbi:MAG TPA: LemA family protein [Gemmatimonadales bacterium]|nr:LemA family protein [Gemmatimonadales bacterium]
MGWALLVSIIVVGGYLAVTFNGLTRLRMLARNAWADIDVQLKRRHDLIPNLVAAVKGHSGYEKGTLESVVEARNRALAASGPAAAGTAERALAGQVRQLLAIAESYPELRAGESFLALQRSLIEIEDHIQSSRRYYNAVVRDLNTRIAQFPSNLVAAPFGFGPEEFFGLADESEGTVPKVDV